MTDIETFLWLFNNKARFKRSGDVLSVEVKGWHVAWRYTTEHNVIDFIRTQLAPTVISLDHQLQKPEPERDSLTVGKLMEQLEAFPWDIEVRRLMTADFGPTEIERITLHTNGYVLID